jgi:hypothetical protein
MAIRKRIILKGHRTPGLEQLPSILSDAGPRSLRPLGPVLLGEPVPPNHSNFVIVRHRRYHLVRNGNDGSKAQDGHQANGHVRNRGDLQMGLRMPPKLADGVRRVALMAPIALITRINAWRQRQADVPNLSEAIRRLIEMALDTAEKPGKPKAKG